MLGFASWGLGTVLIVCRQMAFVMFETLLTTVLISWCRGLFSSLFSVSVVMSHAMAVGVGTLLPTGVFII